MTIEQEMNEVGALLLQHQSPNRRLRLPLDLRARVVRMATSKEGRRIGLKSLSQRLGIKHNTLHRLVRNAPSSRAPSAFLSVEVAEKESHAEVKSQTGVAEQGGALSLVHPLGFRVEGLTVSHLEILLRGLL